MATTKNRRRAGSKAAVSRPGEKVHPVRIEQFRQWLDEQLDHLQHIEDVIDRLMSDIQDRGDRSPFSGVDENNCGELLNSLADVMGSLATINQQLRPVSRAYPDPLEGLTK